MANERDIRQKIIEIARGKASWLFLAEVTGVAGLTCSVRMGDTELSDVQLTALANENNSLLVTPAVGSMVLVADLSGGDRRELYVLQYGDIQQITINGGQLGGLPITTNLVEWMNRVAQDMQTLSTLLSTTPVAGNGAPLGAAFSPQTTTLTADDIANNSIKHG